MRKTFGLAAVLMGFVAAVNAAPLSNSQDTTVTSVDRGGKKFIVQSGFGSSTYNATDRTVSGSERRRLLGPRSRQDRKYRSSTISTAKIRSPMKS